MAKHRLSPEAEAELDAIWLYSARESGSIKNADRMIDGHRVEPKVVWIRGMTDPETLDTMAEAGRRLDQTCRLEESRLLMRDEGYALKQRFFPERAQLEWRIEIREYDCRSARSQNDGVTTRP